MGCGQGKKAPAKDAKKENKDEGSAGPGENKEQEKKQAKAANKDYQGAMKFLESVPLLKRLPKDKLPMLASNMNTKEFEKGQTIVKEGEEGNEFFVIKAGEAKVELKEGGQVATLKAGDYFGEGALLRNEPRAATITVTSATMSCFSLTSEKFRELGLAAELHFANRNAQGGAQKQAVAKPPSPKTDDDRELIKKGLQGNQALAGVVTLDDARIQKLCDVAWKEEIAQGTKVVEEGDPNADYFYIVAKGKFEVTLNSQEEGAGQSEKGENSILGVVETGQSFGELALLYLTPRAATVTAAAASVVWVIDRTNFKNILMQVSDKKVDEYIKLLNHVDALSALLSEDKKKVAKAMVEMHFSKDEIILQQGEKGATFYLLYEGEVGVIKDGTQVQTLKVKNASQPPVIFGEKALLADGDNQERAATVKVLSETAKALALDRHTFQMVLKPLKEVMEGNTTQDPARARIQRKDLSRIGLLGCGGFGAVELWEHKTSGVTYAMKALSKGYIVKTGMQESVMNEKNILNMTNSGFIIKLFETYNGQQSLYFLMEPALGGELYATYNRKGLHGSDKHARFYLAGVVFAFEHCHERHIIYRDLKPENLLLTDKGMLKLTDMGLAKFVIGKTFTTCGTPDYFAPEIIASTGHTNAVDWWMLGILLFELLSGRPPFESAYPMQTYSKVMKGINKITFPNKCTGPAEVLIKGLLKREPAERLPMRPGGTSNIKDAKWYSQAAPAFSWEGMVNNEMEPPYKPTVKSAKDIANFSARKEDMPKQLEYRDDGSGWDKDFATEGR